MNKYPSTLEQFKEAEREVRKATAALEEAEANRRDIEARLPTLWIVQGYAGEEPKLSAGIHFVSDDVRDCANYCRDRTYFVDEVLINEGWYWIRVGLGDAPTFDVGVIRMIRPYDYQIWRDAQKWLEVNHVHNSNS